MRRPRAGPFATSPVVRIFTIDPAERDELGTQPARHRARRRRHARLRRLPDDARRRRRGPRRQHRPPARPLRPSCRPIRRELEHPARQDRLLHLASVLVRPRLGRLLVVPPGRPHRQRDLVVRGRPAPDDLARRHVQQHRRPARPAPAQLDAGARREPGLRAQHARHLRRPRLHHDQHRRERGRHHARLRPQRPQLRPRELEPGAAAGRHHELDRVRRSAARSRRPARAATRRTAATSSARSRPAAPTASPATAAPSGRRAASPTIRST